MQTHSVESCYGRHDRVGLQEAAAAGFEQICELGVKGQHRNNELLPKTASFEFSHMPPPPFSFSPSLYFISFSAPLQHLHSATAYSEASGPNLGHHVGTAKVWPFQAFQSSTTYCILFGLFLMPFN